MILVAQELHLFADQFDDDRADVRSFRESCPRPVVVGQALLVAPYTQDAIAWSERAIDDPASESTRGGIQEWLPDELHDLLHERDGPRHHVLVPDDHHAVAVRTPKGVQDNSRRILPRLNDMRDLLSRGFGAGAGSPAG